MKKILFAWFVSILFFAAAGTLPTQWTPWLQLLFLFLAVIGLQAKRVEKVLMKVESITGKEWAQANSGLSIKNALEKINLVETRYQLLSEIFERSTIAETINKVGFDHCVSSLVSSIYVINDKDSLDELSVDANHRLKDVIDQTKFYKQMLKCHFGLEEVKTLEIPYIFAKAIISTFGGHFASLLNDEFEKNPSLQLQNEALSDYVPAVKRLKDLFPKHYLDLLQGFDGQTLCVYDLPRFVGVIQGLHKTLVLDVATRYKQDSFVIFVAMNQFKHYSLETVECILETLGTRSLITFLALCYSLNLEEEKISQFSQHAKNLNALPYCPPHFEKIQALILSYKTIISLLQKKLDDDLCINALKFFKLKEAYKKQFTDEEICNILGKTIWTGATRKDVELIWGVPHRTSRQANWEYWYYPNTTGGEDWIGFKSYYGKDQGVQNFSTDKRK